MNLNLPQKIIQILLFEGASLKKSDLAKILNIKIGQVDESIDEIKKLISNLELKLVQNESNLEISLSNEINTLINSNKIEELKTELSESALQTLSVIIYRNRATKAEIDFIRGVDSSRSIKNLLTRGIIQKEEIKSKKYYIPSTETLKYLNVEVVEEVPEQKEISEKLKILIEGE